VYLINRDGPKRVSRIIAGLLILIADPLAVGKTHVL